MVAYTPAYLLPFAEGGDRPCDIDDVSCAFAAAVETQLAALDDVVDRTYTTVPMAWVRTLTPFTATQNTIVPVPFDTTVVDTDNMVDLSAFSSGFTTTRSGLYLIWVYLRGSATVVTGADTNASYIVFVEPATAVFSSILLPDLQFTQVTLGQFQRQAVMSVTPLPAGTSVGLRVDMNGAAGDTMTYTEGDIGAIWVGELP